MKQSGRRDQNSYPKSYKNPVDLIKILIELWTETFFTINSSLNCLIFFYKNSVVKVVQKCYWCMQKHAFQIELLIYLTGG